MGKICEDLISFDGQWNEFEYTGKVLSLTPELTSSSTGCPQVRICFLADDSSPSRYFRLFSVDEYPEGVHWMSVGYPDGSALHLFETFEKPE